jgi:hypothetical protein
MMQAQIDSVKSVANANTGFLDQIGADIGSSMGDALKQSMVESLVDLWSTIKDGWGAVKEWLSTGKNPGMAFNPFTEEGWTKHFADMNKKATGGFVSSNQSYLVGEEGPEVFTPTSSGNIIPNKKIGNMGNNLTVNVYGNINNQQGFSPEEIGQIINRQIILSQQGAF